MDTAGGMEYQRQITDTGELQRVIRQLAGEMEYTYAPLAQVCASVSRRCSQNYRIWLEHLAKELEKMPAAKKQSKEKNLPGMWASDEKKKMDVSGNSGAAQGTRIAGILKIHSI